MHVGDNFERGVALHERHLHVERAEIDAQDGLGEDGGGEGGEDGETEE